MPLFYRVAPGVFGFDSMTMLGSSGLLFAGVERGGFKEGGGVFDSLAKRRPPSLHRERRGYPNRRVWPRSPVNFWLLSAVLGA